MGGPCGASSDAPVSLSRYANLYGPPSLIGVRKRKPIRFGALRRHAIPPGGLINLLRLLAGAPDLGAPTEEVLDGTFSVLEYLAADAERLYAAAEQHTRP